MTGSSKSPNRPKPESHSWRRLLVVLLITALFAVLMPALPVRAVQKTLHIVWSYLPQYAVNVDAWRFWADELQIAELADQSARAHDVVVDVDSRKTRIRMTAVAYDANGVEVDSSDLSRPFYITSAGKPRRMPAGYGVVGGR